jgi:hypothetical protein
MALFTILVDGIIFRSSKEALFTTQVEVRLGTS